MGGGGGGGLSPAMLHRLKKNSLSIMASVMRTLNINSEIQERIQYKKYRVCLKSLYCTLKSNVMDPKFVTF